tara:strand:+ start:1529 stop:2188 length:660 start_codon:yes stop_codon:yes gene_type:complete
MREHPIPPVTEPFQYRAIGIFRGVYCPEDKDNFTRGFLIDADGIKVESVVLGRVISLMRRHLLMEKSHLWVVYPRCRENDHLHLQISGIWEPSTLSDKNIDNQIVLKNENNENNKKIDEVPEGDNYFSIRGELIYTRPETDELVIKVRQRPRSQTRKNLPFKLLIKGNLSLDFLRNFVSLEVKRQGQNLFLENYQIIGPVPKKNSKKGGQRKINSNTRN